LANLIKVLDATKKTSRAGAFGTNILNRMIYRGIGDILVPDNPRAKDMSKKMRGYMGDIAGEMTAMGQSFAKGAVNPFTGDPWGDVADKLDPILGPQPQSQTSSIPTPFLGIDQRPRISVPGKGGVEFATEPNVTPGIFGGDITQKPAGYQGGNPYYSLIDMLK